MERVLSFLALLVVFVVAAAVLPVGLAIARTWNPATTTSLLTAAAGICGGAVALAGLGAGIAFGVKAAGSRSRQVPEDQWPAGGHSQVVDPYQAARTAKMAADAGRSQLRFHQEQQAYLQPPEEEEGWLDAGSWTVVDRKQTQDLDW